MESLIEGLENFTINNDSNMEQQRNFIIQNLKMIHPFTGQGEKLCLYVSSIENIVPNIVQLPADDRTLFFNCILRTLDGDALNLVRREQPEDWSNLKQLLIAEYGEQQSIPTLILNISSIRFKGSVARLCDEINENLCKINDTIKLSSESIARKTFYKAEANSQALVTLKKQLPNHLTALINANLATDFNSAKNILRQNNELDTAHNKQESTKPSRSNHFCYYPQVINKEFRNIATQNRNRNTFNNPIPNNYNNSSINNDNRPFYNYNNNPRNNNFNLSNSNNNRHFNNPRPYKRQRTDDSVQSRIRRFGPPSPMEVENFHFMAPNSSPQ